MLLSTISATIPTGIIFPDIDPIIFSLGPIHIRWYALSYVAGILLGWYYLGTLNNKNRSPISRKAYDDFMVWAVFGIILGGRLGYVFFYNAPYYLSHPADIIKVWHGGMSFHGGLIGVITAMYLMCRWHKLRFLAVMDLIACITPIGLFFGRIANFINGELYGRAVKSEIPWGVIFPGDSFARHPSQIYEALLEGLILFIIMSYLVFKTKIIYKKGALSGIFLVGYALSRSFVELFREPDAHIGYITWNLTMGQILSFPMIVIGMYLIFAAHRQVKAHDAGNENKEPDKT